METWVPAVLAVSAALLIAGGTVLRQRASAASGAITRGWWVGATIAIAGFGLQAAALGLGTILLVQPLVVLAVLFSLPFEAWADHRHPELREWAWGAVLVACVVTFLLVARPTPSLRRPDLTLIGITVISVIGVVIAFVIIAERSSPHYRALFYGLTAGVLFGVSALLIKTVIYQAIHFPLEMFRHPEVYLLAIVIVGAIGAQQRGFGAGDLQTSFPAMVVMEPVVSMILGIVLLGEDLKVSTMTALFLGVILAILARSVIELAKTSAFRGQAAPTPSADELAAGGHSTNLDRVVAEYDDRPIHDRWP
ncbi:DMT family transporter [Gordonia effusa]|uniref:DMT family transporter n=1 Tax=Gordonia effusa TaxID=263908 RepID=UPI001B8D0E28|nr:DMT family transporter [Gordonia effusa]